MELGYDIAKGAEIIKSGGLVAFPTETVYGLGADGLNAQALAKIFEAKQRPTFDPLILHISSLDQLPIVLKQPIDSRFYKLAETFWPGPLTIVHEKSEAVPYLATSNLPTVAIRIPEHPIALELIRLAKTPIAAPSANLFGRLSPTSAQHVAQQLSHIDYIIDGGNTRFGVESTIVALQENNVIEILRPGAITQPMLKKAMPECDVILKAHHNLPNAPGMLDSHYAPQKPLTLHDSIIENNNLSTALLMPNAAKPVKNSAGRVIYLSKNGDLIEMASNLFAALHTLEDDQSIESIMAERIAEEGIGIAIMDRLKKASFKYKTI